MYLLFDIGGSNIKIAFAGDAQTFEEPLITATPQDFNAGMQAILKAARELTRGRRVVTACGGVAGVMNQGKNELVRSPHLPLWIGKPLAEELKKILAAPVMLQNDTALVGLGEAHRGAGRGKDIVVYITVSTGVGGVRIVDGRIDRNQYGFEPGHQIIDVSGGACESCNTDEHDFCGRGHLENYISGSALKKRFGKEPNEILNPVVWDELAKFLAYGLNNTILHWSPNVVVLGGSMMVREVGIKISAVEKHLKKILTIFPELPEIRKAELGEIGGLHGALAFIRGRGRM